MLLIEQGFEIWPGDIQWLIAQNLVIAHRGIAYTEKDGIIQNMMALELLNTNAGEIWRE